MNRLWLALTTYRPRSNSGCLLLAFYGLVAAIACFGALVPPVAAQQRSAGWSPPQAIVSTDGSLASGGIALVSDPSGQLHLFYCHHPQESVPGSIDYMRWDGYRWSQPVDVVVDSPGFSPVFMQAAIDPQQVLHLIWLGENSTLKHASAPVSQAGSAWAWSKPQPIAVALQAFHLVVGPDGTLYVAYLSLQPVGHLLLTSSSDGGTTWSDYTVVASSATGTTPGEPSLTLDGTGRLHIAWTDRTLPTGEPRTGIYYSHSTDDGMSWLPPLQVAGERHGEPGVSAVGDGEIHLVWRSNIGGDGTFHQWSADGGMTWSDPDVYDDRGGISGMPSFAVDSAGVLHYVIGPAFVTSWNAGSLQPYVDVAGEQLRTNTDGDPEWSHPERAAIAITLGNELHVVFADSFRELWHTRKLTHQTPALPHAPLPAPRQTTIPLTEPAAHSSATAVESTAPGFNTATSSILTADTPQNSANDLYLPMAIIPAALIVGTVVLARLISARKG